MQVSFYVLACPSIKIRTPDGHLTFETPARVVCPTVDQPRSCEGHILCEPTLHCDQAKSKLAILPLTRDAPPLLGL